MSQILDAAGLDGLIETLAGQVRALGRTGVPMRLVGIRRRGVPVAQRLAARLGPGGPVGAVDVTLYRDDVGHRPHWAVLKGTEIPFEVEGCDVVLVDDVFFTGRTARAALNAVCDLGRPARVLLAALVDRGGHELPLRPDCAALTLNVPLGERILVRIQPSDPADEVLRVPGPEGQSERP